MPDWLHWFIYHEITVTPCAIAVMVFIVTALLNVLNFDREDQE